MQQQHGRHPADRTGSGPAAADAAPGGPRRPVALFFVAAGGGVQKVQVVLANALVGRGFDVDCVMPEAAGPYLPDLLPRVRVVDLGTRRPVGLVRALARYLRHARPAALLATQQHAILAALWARRLAGAPVPVAIVQQNTLSELCRQSRKPVVRLLLPTMARLFFRWADRVGAASRGVAEDLAALTGIPLDRIEVIYNPVVTPDLAARAAAASGHPWLDGRKDRPVVVGAGNLIRIKDYATLIRAFARVRAARPARLVIVGDGEERPHLERLARDLGVAADVELPGFTPNPYAFMARADVFAHASRVEGLGNVLIEALACGCPVVSTDCPSGPAEILDGGRFGRLVPVGDDAALAEAILATLREAPDRDRLRTRAALFTAERAVDRYLRLLGLRDGGGGASGGLAADAPPAGA